MGLEVYVAALNSCLSGRAGIVEAVGAQVTKYKPGDRVMALVDGGGYATCIILTAFAILFIVRLRGLRDAGDVSV